MTEAPDQMLQKRVELILQQLEGVAALPPMEQLEADAATHERAVKLIATVGGEAGADALRYCLLAIGTYQVFESNKPKAESFDRAEFWRHCVAVGCCAELIAQQMIDTW